MSGALGGGGVASSVSGLRGLIGPRIRPPRYTRYGFSLLGTTRGYGSERLSAHRPETACSCQPPSTRRASPQDEGSIGHSCRARSSAGAEAREPRCSRRRLAMPLLVCATPIGNLE